MAKKRKTSERVSAEQKHGIVIRMSKRDCDRILDTLKHLEQGDPTNPEQVRRTREAAQTPQILKMITLVHKGLCMSCPAGGKVVVVDIQSEKSKENE
jgi:hypothetical protein